MRTWPIAVTLVLLAPVVAADEPRRVRIGDTPVSFELPGGLDDLRPDEGLQNAFGARMGRESTVVLATRRGNAVLVAAAQRSPKKVTAQELLAQIRTWKQSPFGEVKLEHAEVVGGAPNPTVVAQHWIEKHWLPDTREAEIDRLLTAFVLLPGDWVVGLHGLSQNGYHGEIEARLEGAARAITVEKGGAKKQR
jgi:hypothetical protein